MCIYVGIVTQDGFVLNGERWEVIIFQLGNIRLTSSRCKMKIICNKVLYHHNHHITKPHSSFALETLCMWEMLAVQTIIPKTHWVRVNFPFVVVCCIQKWKKCDLVLFLLSFFSSEQVISSCCPRITGAAFHKIVFLLYSYYSAIKQLIWLLTCKWYWPYCCQSYQEISLFQR